MRGPSSVNSHLARLSSYHGLGIFRLQMTEPTVSPRHGGVRVPPPGHGLYAEQLLPGEPTS